MPIFQSSSSGPLPVSNVVSVTTTYVATTANDIIYASGSPFTITLPAVSGNTGKVITIQKTDASLTNIITVSGTGLSTTLNTQSESVDFVCAAAAWSALNRTYPQIAVAYTPTLTGFGTASGIAIFSRRVGDSVHVYGKFTSGTATATEARMTLGFGGTNANVTSRSTLTTVNLAGTGTLSANAAYSYTVLMEPSVGYVTFGRQGVDSAGLSKANGNALIGTDTISVNFIVPIQGWN